ncbi:hypothetical protein AB1Y20_012298 [Prymnesium parvum]|uniref:Uncharacterized protein n=1 Tax=Prymnesium parvum TaxID=97485 RepID=A0AB34INP9_PRYPA
MSFLPLLDVAGHLSSTFRERAAAALVTAPSLPCIQTRLRTLETLLKGWPSPHRNRSSTLPLRPPSPFSALLIVSPLKLSECSSESSGSTPSADELRTLYTFQLLDTPRTPLV